MAILFCIILVYQIQNKKIKSVAYNRNKINLGLFNDLGADNINVNNSSFIDIINIIILIKQFMKYQIIREIKYMM